MINNYLSQLNETNSSKVKLETLKKIQKEDDGTFKKVLAYTYDKVTYTFGVTPRTVENFSESANSYTDMFALLDDLNTRKLTGNKALAECKGFINTSKDADLFMKIIDRDLKCGINAKTVSKVYKDVIKKPAYCRCGVLSKKLADKMSFPAFLQLKCDGTYRECTVQNGVAEFRTRSGEPYENPVLAEIMSVLPEGVYTGEFTVGKADEPDANRSVGNGMINSDTPDFSVIHFTIWDYLSFDEYNLVKKTPYATRFENLKGALKGLHCDLVHIVPTFEVQNLDEALKLTSDFMNKGLEGGVLKDKNMIFKNGTSNQQLKIKLKVDADLRVVGFLKGTKGTKYETKNKVIVYQTDDGKIKGQCSGMTDAMIEEVTAHPEKYIGGIVAVQFNDLMKAEGHDYHALSHPRFISFRDDKLESDTFERVCELRDMARSLS